MRQITHPGASTRRLFRTLLILKVARQRPTLKIQGTWSKYTTGFQGQIQNPKQASGTCHYRPAPPCYPSLSLWLPMQCVLQTETSRYHIFNLLTSKPESLLKRRNKSLLSRCLQGLPSALLTRLLSVLSPSLPYSAIVQTFSDPPLHWLIHPAIPGSLETLPLASKE